MIPATGLQRFCRIFVPFKESYMRIGIIDRTMFAVMSSTCVKELRKEHPEWNGRAIMRNARKRVVKMLKETPSIGSYSENCWKINLVGGAVWFAIYEAVEELYGRMPGELYSRMCNATYAIPIMAKKYATTPFFTQKYQDAYIKKIDRANKIKSEYNWATKYDKGPTPESLRIQFTCCGLCALATRTGHRDILPIMCKTDYTVADMMGVCLHRNKTLATGDVCCDYLYTKPGSEIEKQWQAEHTEGTFNSK